MKIVRQVYKKRPFFAWGYCPIVPRQVIHRRTKPKYDIVDTQKASDKETTVEQRKALHNMGK